MREMGSAGGAAGSVDMRDDMVGRCALREDLNELWPLCLCFLAFELKETTSQDRKADDVL